MNSSQALGALGLVIALFAPIALARWGPAASRASAYRVTDFLAAQALLVMIVVVVAWIAMNVLPGGASDLGLARGLFDVRSWLRGMALAAFFVVVFGPALYWVLRRVKADGFDSGLSKLRRLPLWCLVLAVLVGAIAEEFLYRAYAIEMLSRATGSLLIAALVPLALFAIAHAPLWGVSAAIATLASGAILTAFYLWQRDLVANVIAHGLTDFFGIVVPAIVARRGRSSP